MNTATIKRWAFWTIGWSTGLTVGIFKTGMLLTIGISVLGYMACILIDTAWRTRQ